MEKHDSGGGLVTAEQYSGDSAALIKDLKVMTRMIEDLQAKTNSQADVIRELQHEREEFLLGVRTEILKTWASSSLCDEVSALRLRMSQAEDVLTLHLERTAKRRGPMGKARESLADAFRGLPARKKKA